MVAKRRKQRYQTISEIVNLVLEAKGSRKGLTELLLPDTYQKFLDSMRVPGWALLYFKLKARLPDDAWQTLLNLTQLGKSRVCKLRLHFVHCVSFRMNWCHKKKQERKKNHVTYVSINSKLQLPPPPLGKPPGHLNF